MTGAVAWAYGLIPVRYRRLAVTGAGFAVVVASLFELHGTALRIEAPAVAALTILSHYAVTDSDGAPLTASAKLQLLPAPHPSRKRTGAVITTDHHDYTPDRLTPKPKDVSGAWHTILAALKIMLLNDRLGDCTIAAYLKLVMILCAITGRPIPKFTDADALHLYEQWDGYIAGRQSTDLGGDPREVLKMGQTEGIGGIRLGTFASIPAGSLPAIRAALRAHGALYSALYLPDDYDRIGFRWVVQPHDPPDPNEGHAVVVVMFAGKFFALTWGGLATVSPGFLTRYFVQHFAVDGLAA